MGCAVYHSSRYFGSIPLYCPPVSPWLFSTLGWSVPLCFPNGSECVPILFFGLFDSGTEAFRPQTRQQHWTGGIPSVQLRRYVSLDLAFGYEGRSHLFRRFSLASAAPETAPRTSPHLYLAGWVGVDVSPGGQICLHVAGT